MTVDSLERLGDGDLQAIISRAQELLKRHDTERKDKALSEARATLAAVGLSLKDVARKASVKPKGTNGDKGPIYRAGQIYQNPANKVQVWAGKGKKPGWLVELEAEGGKAVEVTDNAPMKKTA